MRKSAQDIEGDWIEPEVITGLIERCREHWSTPVDQLPNVLLATFLNQRIALVEVVPEARSRIEQGFDDDSELYDCQLIDALASVI